MRDYLGGYALSSVATFTYTNSNAGARLRSIYNSDKLKCYVSFLNLKQKNTAFKIKVHHVRK